MTDDQIPNTAEAAQKKFSFSLYSYFITMTCLICIALTWFIVRASSANISDGDLLRQVGISGPSQSVDVFLQIKTSDEGAQNLLRYVMNNPPKASEREHMAKNLQESGIDLYQASLESLERFQTSLKYHDGDVSKALLIKDSQTLKTYCTLNVQFFSLLKAAVLEGQDPRTLQNDELYRQIDGMKNRVGAIYHYY